MKRKNLFDLLALKEKVSSNKYLQKLKPLQEEKIKVEKILVQLNELKNDKNSNLSTSAWELKSASNIQEKIFEQIALAQLRLKNISLEIFNLEKKFIEFNCVKVVMPEHNSRIGNPVVLPKNYFNTLKSLKNDFGARSLIRKKDIITLKTGFGTIFDIDTIDQLNETKTNYLLR